MHASAFSKQPCRQYARIVHHQQFVALEKFRELPKLAIFPITHTPVQKQKPRGVTLFEWSLGDQFARQLVIKRVHTHGATITKRGNYSRRSGKSSIPMPTASRRALDTL